MTNKKKLKLRKKKLINYIKKDYCEYDGEVTFFNINKLILENYLEYYSFEGDTTQCDEHCLKIVKQLQEALVIANRMVANNYDIEATTWYSEHNKTIVFLYNPTTHETVTLGEYNASEEDHLVDNYIKEHPEFTDWLCGYRVESDSDENYKTWLQLVDKANKAKSKDFKDFFMCIAKNGQKWSD